MTEDLTLDLEELKQLQSIAKRPRVVSIISSEIQKLEKLSKDAIPTPISPSSNSVSTAVKPTSSAINFITLSSFSWDEDNEKIKIYFFLEGVEQEKVETEITPTSFDIKFNGVRGKNYRCAMPKLNKDIIPEKCKLVVKPTKVIATLFKASRGKWIDLHQKEDKFKPGLDKGKDPMAGVMDLMKNMYDDGDEDMKRTIAKAWTDARSGKAADSLKGYPE